MPDTVLGTLHSLFCLILTAKLWNVIMCHNLFLVLLAFFNWWRNEGTKRISKQLARKDETRMWIQVNGLQSNELNTSNTISLWIMYDPGSKMSWGISGMCSKLKLYFLSLLFPQRRISISVSLLPHLLSLRGEEWIIWRGHLRWESRDAQFYPFLFFSLKSSCQVKACPVLPSEYAGGAFQVALARGKVCLVWGLVWEASLLYNTVAFSTISLISNVGNVFLSFSLSFS